MMNVTYLGAGFCCNQLNSNGTCSGMSSFTGS